MPIPRKLPDMDMTPKPRRYRPPAESVREEVDYSPIDLALNDDGQHNLHVAEALYHQRIVDFALTQTVVIDGTEHVVARIDCCHGTIHRHAYLRDGTDVLDHLVICDLWDGPEAWDTVNAEYADCYGRMIDEAESNYRRWRRGS